MSTSLLYHGFGISGYRYIRTEYREGDVLFTISERNSAKIAFTQFYFGQMKDSLPVFYMFFVARWTNAMEKFCISIL
ncbi:MAG: hypothetical protein ACI8ZB_001117 [Desulforhopalus sp.]|jgi:hypothetical protein